jgi:phosphoglycolate phosphatase
MRLDAFEHVIFDMDGVLLDSNGMKVAAAHAAMQVVEPRASAAFAAHFRGNFGLSRREHFAWGYEQLLCPLGHEVSTIDRLIADYASRVKDGYAGCGVTRGTLELLELMRSPRYVLTGSDEQHARVLLAELGLAEHFVEIVGSPATKIDNLDRLITRHGIRPARALMIGDSQHDYAAARSFGIPFLLVTGYAAEDPRPLAELVRQNGGTVVQALDELNLNEVQ